MAIRCADSNPRQLIKIFNSLLMLLSRDQKKQLYMRRTTAAISREDQTRVMRALSATKLSQVRSYPEVGPKLHAFLTMLGEYMRAHLHARPLTTDQVTSVEVGRITSDEDWKLIEVAVGHGLLYPNIEAANTDDLPNREGTFHLAYVLAPHFLLLPRRGKVVSLGTIYRYQRLGKEGRKAILDGQDGELPLFNAGDNR